MQREAGLCEKYSTTALAIRYLEKLKLSQESLSDEVSLFQQLLKFFSFASNTRLLLLLFGNDNRVGCGKGVNGGVTLLALVIILAV